MAYYTSPYLNYYQPMVQQPMVTMPVIDQQQPMLSPPQNTNSYFIWVQGEAGAKSYPVARGTTVPLFDTEGDFIYFKTVDQNGMPLPLVKKAISDPPIEIENKSVEISQPEMDMSNYVTREKYEALEERVLELETRPPVPTINTTITDSTFNNSRKGKNDANKYAL